MDGFPERKRVNGGAACDYSRCQAMVAMHAMIVCDTLHTRTRTIYSISSHSVPRTLQHLTFYKRGMHECDRQSRALKQKTCTGVVRTESSVMLAW